MLGDIKSKKRVFVGMSGGVDSSVAAYLLKKQGYEVTGIFMRCYNIDGCAETDAEDARRAAEHLQIPFYVWDFEEEYKDEVVEYMIEGYRRGLTPNPDVMCNRKIKFGLFLEKALSAGADYVATGHYIQTEERILNIEYRGNSKRLKRQNTKSYILKSAVDANKDQSYFLWTLTQKQLRYCLFPIGSYLKSEVREIARRAGLPTADKKDSQGICFLGKFSVADFLKQHITAKSGQVVTVSGRKIGEHDGAYFYTIGQRHGLDLNGKNRELKIKGKTETKPHYVAKRNMKTNTIIVAEGKNHPALYKKEVNLISVNLINPSYSNALKGTGTVGMPVLARVRYRQELSPAVLSEIKSKSADREAKILRLIFEKPQKFVAEGQSAVFYAKDYTSMSSGRNSSELRMIGGGVIESSK